MTALSTSMASPSKSRNSKKGWTGLRLALAAALLPALLSACGGMLEPAGLAAPALSGDDLAKYQPSDEPYRAGAEHFSRGEYGLAESYFREAAEKSPQSAAAWIGLAASYDRLSRFDLADRAYNTAIKLSGETAQILNNRGYSYLLRGNLPAARANFARARALEPENPLVQNNMKLLASSAKYVKPKAP
ncbi:MAG: tetratricopeptide repeat protein [Rhodomicrobium sp.]